MFLTYQYPIADLRRFRTESGLLGAPAWPRPQTSEFVRSFGQVTERSQDAPFPSIWGDEGYYINARAALRFSTPNSELMRARPAPGTPRLRPVLRRLYCNGSALARLELAFRLRVPPGSAFSIDEHLPRLLREPMLAYRFKHEPEWLTLDRLAFKLDNLYFDATSRGDHLEDASSRPEVICGSPALFIQHDPYEDVQASDAFRSAELGPDSVTMLGCHDLQHGLVTRFRRKFHIWKIETEHFRGKKERMLRTGLARIHTERQVLLAVLRAISTGAMRITDPNVDTKKLGKYLTKAAAWFRRDKVSEIPLALIRNLASVHEQSFRPGDLAVLESQLTQITFQVAENISALIDSVPQPSGGGVSNIHIGEGANASVTIINAKEGSTVGDVINIVGQNTFNNSPIKSQIQNSFNTTNSLPEDDEKRKLLEDLIKQVAALAEEINDQDDADAAGRKLETFTKEANAAKPDKNLLKLTGDGLVEAAKTVGKMVGPITKTVTALLALF
ncbi:MAG: hypothetical protein AAGB51_09830 [Planctomycetota bacterium]